MKGTTIATAVLAVLVGAALIKLGTTLVWVNVLSTALLAMSGIAAVLAGAVVWMIWRNRT